MHSVSRADMGAPDHNGDLMGRTFIGEDDVGNRYYEVPNPGRKPNPKREVHYSEKDPVILTRPSLRLLPPTSPFPEHHVLLRMNRRLLMTAP